MQRQGGHLAMNLSDNERILIKLGGISGVVSGVIGLIVLLGVSLFAGASLPDRFDAISLLEAATKNRFFFVVFPTIAAVIPVVMMIASLGLYAVFRRDFGGYAIPATTFSIIGILLIVLVEVPLLGLILPTLADLYATAQFSGEKNLAILLTQLYGNYVLFAVLYSDLFIASSVAIFSVAMRKSSFFPKWLSWLGVTITALGYVGIVSIIGQLDIRIVSREVEDIISGIGGLAVALLVPWVTFTGRRMIVLARELQ
jgi:hypothetical protein